MTQPRKGRPRSARADATARAERERLARKSARQTKRQEEIVAAASEIAERTGLDAFTASDVAQALSMSTPSLFYYFPGGLSELRATIALRRFYARTAPCLRAVEAARTGKDALIALLRGLAGAYTTDPEGFSMDLEIMQRGSWGEDLVQLHITTLNDLFTVIENKLEADRAAGRLHPQIENLRRIAVLMNQLVIGLVVGDQMIRKVGGGSKHTFDALLRDLCGLVERGVTKPRR